MQLIDITGMKFGRLTVIGRSTTPPEGVESNKVYWDCICECGNTCKAEGWNLRNGQVKSCGCLHSDTMTKHGDYNKPLYKVWSAMKRRCNNSNDKAYPWYGGKGVRVCPEWNDNYLAFKEWALSNGYQQGLTIDRIDSSKDYCPENCQWITQSENSQRTARNLLTVNGITKSVRQWCRDLGVGGYSVEHWIKRHGEDYATQRIDAILNPDKYTDEQRCSLGIGQNVRRYATINGETLSYSAWSKRLGFSHHMVSTWADKYGDEYAIAHIKELLDSQKE